MTDDPGFGIYIHWPFCAAKCPYCDFNSPCPPPAGRSGAVCRCVRPRDGDDAGADGWSKGQFDLSGRRHAVADGAGDGGGGAGERRAALDRAGRDRDHAGGESVIRRGGAVSRLSGGGGQSGFARRPGAERCRSAVPRTAARCRGRAARDRAGARDFPAAFVRPDLCAAAPGASTQWAAELDRAIGYAADHLSLYQLTIEDGTRFQLLHEAGKFVMPEPDHAADLYKLTQEVTARADCRPMRFPTMRGRARRAGTI